MSKYHKIKWRESDYEELNKAVRNFNAKITRLTKKNPKEANALPDKITVVQMKKLINTRQDLKREINALRRFSKRGAEEIVFAPDNDNNLKLTKWQRTEMNRRVAIINRKRAERLKDLSNLEATSRGKGLGYKLSEVGMGRATEMSLTPMNAFTPGMTRTWLKKKFLGILAESQSDYFNEADEQLRQNIIKAITENFNINDVSDVVKSIENMDIRDVLKIYQAEGGNFEDFYPNDMDKYNAHLNKIKATWIKK